MNERLHNLSERVTTFLGEMGLEPRQSEAGLYLLRYGSTVVMISLFEEGEETFCRFASIVLKDCNPSLEFIHRILKLNTEVVLGAFLLFDDNTLSFSSTLLGNYMDYDAFDRTLRYVAQISDDYDDELQTLGGGKRAEDLFQPT